MEQSCAQILKSLSRESDKTMALVESLDLESIISNINIEAREESFAVESSLDFSIFYHIVLSPTVISQLHTKYLHHLPSVLKILGETKNQMARPDSMCLILFNDRDKELDVCEYLPSASQLFFAYCYIHVGMFVKSQSRLGVLSPRMVLLPVVTASHLSFFAYALTCIPFKRFVDVLQKEIASPERDISPMNRELASSFVFFARFLQFLGFAYFFPFTSLPTLVQVIGQRPTLLEFV
eukprot:TRINITY_DN841_c0_g1_i12.p1 TRINITY_DN841_c0_g1~~TRINITY_DN841_c0_g1_i12.p1  ORF type:complete len:237 (+),score=32.01 TRINITY_DN841_c0_g1_i12:342-1052(+)